MKVYDEKVYLVVVQLTDNDMHDDRIKIFPCKTYSSAQEFEKYYRETTIEDKLGAINIVESNLYGD